jgi:hypothetical protein
MKTELEQMTDAAKAYRELAMCYRIGKRPTEKLFDRLAKADELLDKKVEPTSPPTPSTN